MAVTGYKKPEEQNQQNQQQQQQQQAQQSYTGLAGVSDNTAQQTGRYQQGYQQSDAVAGAQQRMQETESLKPQSYNSKYGAALDDVLNKIQNPEKFKYDFNSDELFKSYADMYTQYGRQASMDAMGQAAALTGGYGNSYAQNAGNQAYQQYLLGLYDKGMDLRDRAYQQYQDEQAGLKDQYNILADRDDTEYGRYRDTYNDWLTERQYATDRYDTERNFDYNAWAAERDYWTGLAQVENADYRNEQERQEAIRQYEQNFAEDMRRYEQDFAEGQRQYDTSLAENQRQYDTTLAENQRQYDTTFAENQRQYDTTLGENQRQYDTSLAENKRQFDVNVDEKRAENDRQYAYNTVLKIIANGKMPSSKLLKAAGISKKDAKRMIAEQKSTGKTTGGGTRKPKTTNDKDVTGDTTMPSKEPETTDKKPILTKPKRIGITK